jgi:hypothetical protein
MLTLCEDAIQGEGKIDPDTAGVYYRLISEGLSETDLQKYASAIYKLSQEFENEARFPDALLQKIDDNWLTEFPAPSEGSFYRINPYYLRHLLYQFYIRVS